jgi:hypothetical protein
MGTLTLYSVANSQPAPPVVGQRVGNMFEGVWGINDARTIDVGSTTTTFAGRLITSFDSIIDQTSLESVMSLEPVSVIPNGTGAGKDFNILSANKKYTIGCGFMQNRDNTFYLGCANGSGSGAYIAASPVSKNTFRYYIYKVIPSSQTELYPNESGIFSQNLSKTSSVSNITGTDITRVRMLLGYTAAEGVENWQNTLGMFFRPFCYEGETWFPFVNQPWKTGISLFSCIVSYDDATKLITSVDAVIKMGYTINGVGIETLASPARANDEVFVTDKFIGMSGKYTKIITKYTWNKGMNGAELFTENGVPVPIAAKAYAPNTNLVASLQSQGTYYLSRSGNNLLITGAATITKTFADGAPRYVLCCGVGGGAGGSGGRTNHEGVGGQAGGGCLFYLIVPESPNSVTMVIGAGGGYDEGSIQDEYWWSNPGSATYVTYAGSQITMNGGGSENNGGSVSYPTSNIIMGAIIAVTGSTGTYGTGNGVSAQYHPTGVGGSLGWPSRPGGSAPGGGGGGGSSIFAVGGTGGNAGSGQPGSYGSGGGGGSKKFLNGYSGASGGTGRIDIFY